MRILVSARLQAIGAPDAPDPTIRTSTLSCFTSALLSARLLLGCEWRVYDRSDASGVWNVVCIRSRIRNREWPGQLEQASSGDHGLARTVRERRQGRRGRACPYVVADRHLCPQGAADRHDRDGVAPA